MSGRALAPAQMQNRATMSSGILQRKTCSCGRPIVAGGECAECREKRLTLQRKAVSIDGPTTAPPIVHTVLRSSGQQLNSDARGFMEPRFEHDFSAVRVHTDAAAAESARAVNAMAYTFGNHIVFGRDNYSPRTTKGQVLIAHELAHVIQQRGVNSPSSSLELGLPTDPLEQEAERLSQTVIGNQTANLGRRDLEIPQRKGAGLEEHNASQFGADGYGRRGGAFAPHLATVSSRTSSAARLARASYNVGALTIQINYGNIISIPSSNYETEIETRFAGWTGSPASTIHAALSALTTPQKKWVLFGLDILVDNTTASHGSFNRAQGVQRLIAHAPSAANMPLSASFGDFANEILRVSGWFEIALAAQLTAPTGTTLTTITGLYNPPPGPTAPATGALDVARLNSEIPPALTTLLNAIDPASWTSVGTQPIGTIQSIGDRIQNEARTFFSPYADAAMANVYSRGWLYSANISSVTTMVPTQGQRIGYLLNRAEIVGRQSRSGGPIFDNCNFDSSRAADRAELLNIANTMEADPTIQPIVNRLIQHTGRTSRTPSGPQVGISTEFNLGTNTECEARWRTIDTLSHELVHAMVHPRFPASASSVRFGQIIREGFTEVLGVQLYESIRSRATANTAFKAQMETGITGASCPTPAAATIGYGQAGQNAERIRALVGNDNFRAAYFLGALNLVGL